ncbi:MAG: hypothetical protein LBJ61_08510, partial [Deltaproteobacteria bacterium]|nr:hypothetical protein [Deltaproteobacteria bacterium]
MALKVIYVHLLAIFFPNRPRPENDMNLTKLARTLILAGLLWAWPGLSAAQSQGDGGASASGTAGGGEVGRLQTGAATILDDVKGGEKAKAPSEAAPAAPPEVPLEWVQDPAPMAVSPKAKDSTAPATVAPEAPLVWEDNPPPMAVSPRAKNSPGPATVAPEAPLVWEDNPAPMAVSPRTPA